jgi:hypothetical protein
MPFTQDLSKTMPPIELGGLLQWRREKLRFVSTLPYMFMEEFLSTGIGPSAFLTVINVLLCLMHSAVQL